jgi:hypothetical protein
VRPTLDEAREAIEAGALNRQELLEEAGISSEQSATRLVKLTDR